MIQTGFDDPYTPLFRELKLSEEALRQEAIFLRNDKGRIYNMLGVKRNEPENKPVVAGFKIKENYSRPLVQNFYGLIELKLNHNFEPVSINRAIEVITGYSKDDFLSRKVKWREIVVPEDQPLIFEKMEKAMTNPNISTELEYRIKNRDGEIKWLWEILQKLPAGSGIPGETGKMQGYCP